MAYMSKRVHGIHHILKNCETGFMEDIGVSNFLYFVSWRVASAYKKNLWVKSFVYDKRVHDVF